MCLLTDRLTDRRVNRGTCSCLAHNNARSAAAHCCWWSRWGAAPGCSAIGCRLMHIPIPSSAAITCTGTSPGARYCCTARESRCCAVPSTLQLGLVCREVAPVSWLGACSFQVMYCLVMHATRCDCSLLLCFVTAAAVASGGGEASCAATHALSWQSAAEPWGRQC